MTLTDDEMPPDCRWCGAFAGDCNCSCLCRGDGCDLCADDELDRAIRRGRLRSIYRTPFTPPNTPENKL